MQNPAETTDTETPHIESPTSENLPSGAMPDAGVEVGASTLDSITADYTAQASSVATAPLNRDGTPKRKPGRPRKNPQDLSAPAINLGDTPSAASAAPAPVKTPAQKRAQRVSSDELARMVLNLTVGGASAIIGEEWQFQSPEEAQSMKAALSAYIEAKGDGQASPEAMLALVVCAYAVPRFAVENTRTKLGGFFGKCWKAFTGVFKR